MEGGWDGWSGEEGGMKWSHLVADLGTDAAHA